MTTNDLDLGKGLNFLRPNDVSGTVPADVSASWPLRLSCPRCGGTLSRSRVRWYERWRTSISGARPYRCYRCRRRFWKSRAA